MIFLVLWTFHVILIRTLVIIHYSLFIIHIYIQTKLLGET